MAFETSHTDVEARLLARALRPGAVVLDAGCGRTTRLADQRGRISRLIGIDLDAQAVAENEALDEGHTGDLCQALPFADESFDLVYANFVVEHLDDPAQAFSEWRRVLQPGGGLILLTPNRANPLVAVSAAVPRRLRVALKRRGAGVAEEDVIPVRYRANTPARLDALLRAGGFAPAQVAQVATLHRYAARAPWLAILLRGVERALPSRLRSTIVAWYRAV
jgi:SAM-dependent methyltransferase